MRFVPIKTMEQQSALMMHRARDLLIRQRTMLANALRGHLAEFGLIEAQGLHKVARLIAIVMDQNDGRIPDIARQVLKVIVNQIEDTQTRIAELERQVLAWHNNNPVSQRLATIPGIGPIIATAIAATVADPSIFRSGREFAAWLGLVPRQNSTGGKARLGGISKRGDSYLRRLLVNSAHTVLLCSKQAKTDPWLTSLLSRKPTLVVAVALANKTARMAWAIMNGQDTYRRAPLAA
jgi:transposase